MAVFSLAEERADQTAETDDDPPTKQLSSTLTFPKLVLTHTCSKSTLISASSLRFFGRTPLRMVFFSLLAAWRFLCRNV
jgi:hypothetical protein